jgi:type 1 glutamine amidotransferase
VRIVCQFQTRRRHPPLAKYGIVNAFGVPFKIVDPAGAPIEVLAETSNSIKFGKPHPSVFVVKHPKARIAAIALGHDALAHDHAEFKALLTNAVTWAAKD